MALANCPRCGALFNKLAQDVCQKCHKEEEALLRETQEYLRENRAAALFQIIEDLDIDQDLIEKWVREKRITLQSPEEMMGKRFCMECGREMTGPGKLCKTCQLKKIMKKDEKHSTEREKTKETLRGGMYIKRKI